MVEQDREADANRLSAAALQAGDPTGWFEQLYAEAAGGQAIVPWDRGEPHPLLVEWADTGRCRSPAQRTLVVGCGLGEDAAYLSGLGWGRDRLRHLADRDRRRPPPLPGEAGRLPGRRRAGPAAGVDRALRPGVGELHHPGSAGAAAADGDQARGPLRRPGRDRCWCWRPPRTSHVGAGPPWPLSRGEIESYAAEGLTRWRSRNWAPTTPAAGAPSSRGRPSGAGRRGLAGPLPRPPWPRRSPARPCPRPGRPPSAWRSGSSVASPTFSSTSPLSSSALPSTLSPTTHGFVPPRTGARSGTRYLNYDLVTNAGALRQSPS